MRGPRSGCSIDAAKIMQSCESGSIFPVFQPIVHLESGAISSFEVLARWCDDELGVVPPSTFIPIAERLHCIAPLTEYLMERACTAAVRWPGDFRLAFNISPTHFQEPLFPACVEVGPQRAGFPLSRIQIEITEGALIEDMDRARAAVDELKRRGVRISLDDFGTGYSSLTRLQGLPFDKIKIDASFVRTMGQLRESRKIVSAVIGLAQSLGLPTVAEGVETEEQLKSLRQLGCDYGQGWLFGWPVSGDKVPPIIARLGVEGRDPTPLDLSVNRKLAQLEAIYASIPAGLCFLDKDLRFVSANQPYGEMMKVDPDAITGRSILDVFPTISEVVLADLRAALLNQAIPSRHVMLLEDKRRAIVSVGAARDENGEVLGLSVAIVDITAMSGEISRDLWSEGGTRSAAVYALSNQAA